VGKDLIAWWLQPQQMEDYPHLFKMAIDILSIPCMSSAVERLFSSAKLVVTDRRNRLDVFTMEALECIKSWRKLEPFYLTGQYLPEFDDIQDWVLPEDYVNPLHPQGL
jgi:hypothetical protein